MKRWALFPTSLAFLAMSVAAIEACGSSGSATLVTIDDGGGAGAIPEASFAADAWGATSCAACVKTTCNAESIVCRSEPTCARYLDCLATCPTDASGVIDGICISACPAPTGSAATIAKADFEQCRMSGAGHTCEGCGFPPREFQNPLLNQSCPNPTWDAGANASAAAENCTKCGAETCCGSRDRCAADVKCAALRACVNGCSDDAGTAGDGCFDNCRAANPSAQAMYQEYRDCVVIRCPGPCEITFDPCASCLNTTCADVSIACDANPDCYNYLLCFGNCADKACRDKCVTTAQGRSDFDQYLSCTTQCPHCS